MPKGIYDRSRLTFWSTPEYRKKRSQIMKRLAKDPAYIQKQKDSQLRHNREHPEKGRKHSKKMKRMYREEPWRRDLNSRIMKRVNKKLEKDEAFCERRRKRSRRVLKKLLSDPKFMQKVVKSQLHHPSRPEKFIFRSLVYRVVRKLKSSYGVDRRVVDIAIPGRKIAIEVNGAYWHKIRKGAKSMTRRKCAYLKRLGWTVISVTIKTRSRRKHWRKKVHFILSKLKRLGVRIYHRTCLAS